ncbi:MAG: hypothetical protein WEE64_01335 [Dehalococcoidia bacterium]
MKTTQIYKRLAQLAREDTAIRDLLGVTDHVFEDCVNITKTVTTHMREYTLHDEVHLTNVVQLMDRLLPESILKRLQPLELAALIMSAALHDIGMAPPEDEVRSLLRAAEGEVEDEAQLRYASFRQAYGPLIRRQERLRAERRYAEAQEVEAYLLAEYLRQDHGARSREVIFSRFDNRLKYRDFHLAGRLAEVCASHTEDVATLEEIPCWELVAPPGEYANWRFVAVLLRLADILDFDPKRTPRVLFEHLGVRDPISVREWRKHRAITGWDVATGRIAFSAQCPDPVIEKTIRDFVALIDQELTAARATIAGMHDKRQPGLSDRYSLNLPPNVETGDIRAAEGRDGPPYTYVDVAFELDQDSVKGLLMGVRLYANRLLFLRELLQNAVDACRHRAALHARRPDLGKYEPRVIVRALRDGGREFLEVDDNGMGMSQEIIQRYFARIGTSYYSSPSFLQERARWGLPFKPISQFGIGVLSVFMAGDLLEVETLRFGENSQPVATEIASEGSLFWFRKGHRNAPGTRISVRLVSSLERLLANANLFRYMPISQLLGPRSSNDSANALVNAVSRLAPHVEIPIEVHVGGETFVLKMSWLAFDTTAGQTRRIDLDMTGPHALHGLTGRASVFLLTSGGKFVSRMTLSGQTKASSWDEVLHLRHDLQDGSIVYKNRQDAVGSYVPDLVSTDGRWSQQGFTVPDRLFDILYMNAFEFPSFTPLTPFPFPIHYDIDLSDPLCLPLTVDRKEVIRGEEAAAIGLKISGTLSRRFLEVLGPEAVQRNREFFEQAKLVFPDSPFAEALDRFLATQAREHPLA